MQISSHPILSKTAHCAGLPNSVETLAVMASFEPKELSHAIGNHIKKILSVPFISVPKIRNRGFLVVLDTNHGAGGVMGKTLLEALGCEVITLGNETNGIFAHGCEPTPENLTALGRRMRRKSIGIGGSPRNHGPETCAGRHAVGLHHPLRADV